VTDPGHVDAFEDPRWGARRYLLLRVLGPGRGLAAEFPAQNVEYPELWRDGSVVKAGAVKVRRTGQASVGRTTGAAEQRAQGEKCAQSKAHG
jgi:hypothetical protein